MEIRKVWALYYSATGTTDKAVNTIAEALAQALEVPLERVGFTRPAEREKEYSFVETDLVVVGVAIVTFLVLRRGTELVLDDQPGIDEQDDGVVKGRTADTEFLVIGHQRIEGVDVKMAVDGVDGIEYSIAFGSLAMPVRVEIFREYLPNCIFHILTIHAGTVFNSQQS